MNIGDNVRELTKEQLDGLNAKFISCLIDKEYMAYIHKEEKIIYYVKEDDGIYTFLHEVKNNTYEKGGKNGKI